MNLRFTTWKTTISIIIGIFLGSAAFSSLVNCPKSYLENGVSVVTDCEGNLLIRLVLIIISALVIYAIWSSFQKKKQYGK